MSRALAWIVLCLSPLPAWAGPAEDHFENAVRPLLSNHCAKCHDDKNSRVA